VHHSKFPGQCLSWVKRYRPIEPIAPPDVGCCSKTGHGFASLRNVAKGHFETHAHFEHFQRLLVGKLLDLPIVREVQKQHCHSNTESGSTIAPRAFGLIRTAARPLTAGFTSI
jgi:hypothetical protein